MLILTISGIFVSRKGGNYEGTDRTILLRTTPQLLGSMAMGYGIREWFNGYIYQGLPKQGGGKRVRMAAERMGQTKEQIELILTTNTLQL